MNIPNFKPEQSDFLHTHKPVTKSGLQSFIERSKLAAIALLITLGINVTPAIAQTTEESKPKVDDWKLGLKRTNRQTEIKPWILYQMTKLAQYFGPAYHTSHYSHSSHASHSSHSSHYSHYSSYY